MALTYVFFTEGPTLEELLAARASVERGVPYTLTFESSCYMNADMSQRHLAAGMTGIATSVNHVPGQYGSFFISLRDVKHPVGPIVDNLHFNSAKRAALMYLPR